MKKRGFIAFLTVLMLLCTCFSIGVPAVSANDVTGDQSTDWVRIDGKNAETSTIVCDENGVTMAGAAETPANPNWAFGYQYQDALDMANLAATVRLNKLAGADRFYLAFAKAEGDPFAQEGTVLVLLTDGVSIVSYLNAELNVQALKVIEFSASDNKFVNVFMRKEEAGWLVELNGTGDWVTQDSNIISFTDTMRYVSVLGVAEPNAGETASVDCSITVTQVAGRMMGIKKEIGSFASTKGNVNTAQMSATANEGDYTLSGKKNGNLLPIKFGISDTTVGLDGYSMSFEVSEPAGSEVRYDFGLAWGTMGNVDRIDAWDSSDGLNSFAAYAVGVKPGVTSGGLNVYKLGGNMVDNDYGNTEVPDADRAFSTADSPTSMVASTKYVITFAKLGGNWQVFVNGRLFTQGNQTVFNTVMDQLSSKPAYPTVAVDGGSPNEVTNVVIKGLGAQTVGKYVDQQEGVVGDDVTGKLEFNKDDWTSFTPDTATVDYKVDGDGFRMYGINKTTGFAAGVNYGTAIALDQTHEFSATFKLPETVFATDGAKAARYGMFLGEVTHRNFADQKSVYIRWTYASTDPKAGANAEIIVWDNTNPALVLASSTKFIPAKTAAGRETEMTVRIVYNEPFSAYRVYVNGVRLSDSAVEAVLGAHLDGMESKYFYGMCSYELASASQGAWEEGNEELLGYHIVSVNGGKLVNEVPEEVQTITLNDGSDITKDSVTLTWTKAEYPNGEMDSFNFAPTKYLIERIKGTETTVDKTYTVDSLDTLTFTDTGLEANTYYYYTVYAVYEQDGELIKLMRSNKNKRVQTLADEEVDDPTPPAGGCSCGTVGTPGGFAGGMLLFGALALTGLAVISRRSGKRI